MANADVGADSVSPDTVERPAACGSVSPQFLLEEAFPPAVHLGLAYALPDPNEGGEKAYGSPRHWLRPRLTRRGTTPCRVQEEMTQRFPLQQETSKPVAQVVRGRCYKARAYAVENYGLGRKVTATRLDLGCLDSRK